tara:strand:+ start:102 stop:572 length:471 start_codon:yes stop_codon:yes gene_type:complete
MNLSIKNKVMKKLLYLMVVGVVFTSCQKEEFEIDRNYQFKMTGRTAQDVNGYYHLKLDPKEDKQTLHRFGAHITNRDAYNLPTQVIWRSDAFFYTYDGMTVPIVNGISNADLTMDSVYCMMAPIGAMIGDTVTIYGMALFEEGMIEKFDNIKVIFE